MEKKNLKKNNNIFIKNINNNYKLIPLNIKKNYVGEFKYYPAASKEWKNKVYFFNFNFLKNLPVYDVNIHKLIINYFNMYFKNQNILRKDIPHKKKRLSIRKIFVSKPEIKHTNEKILITLYVYNKIKFLFFKKFYKSKSFLKKFLFNILGTRLSILSRLKFKYLYSYFKNILISRKNIQDKKKIKIKLKTFEKAFKFYVFYIIYKKYKIGKLIRKYLFYYNFNNFKFKDIFLSKLGKLISKIYKKKVEFNIIKLKSISFHPDIFTDFLKNKIKRKNIKVLKAMSFILNRTNILKENGIKERARIIKTVNFNLLENKYRSLNLNSILNENNLDKILIDLYYNINIIDRYFYNFLKNNIWFINHIGSFFNKDIILNNIKYKNIRGIKLEIKGRISKRYRADRALFKVKRKGKLNNIDSSFKGLSSVAFRGYMDSNMEYSISSSRRHIGSFAVKGWISGK